MQLAVATDWEGSLYVDAIPIADTGLAIHRVDDPTECWHVVTLDGGLMVTAGPTHPLAVDRALEWGRALDMTSREKMAEHMAIVPIYNVHVRECLRYCRCRRIAQPPTGGQQFIVNRQTVKTEFLNLAIVLLNGRPDGTRISWAEFEEAIHAAMVAETWTEDGM